MGPVEALKAGTIASAQSLGMAKDIGSIEAGKLADLVILSDDPSQDIANSDNIEKVMIGGRLYDARTMNEVGTGDAKRRPYFWEGEGAMGAAGSMRTTSEGRGHSDGDAG
jgi:cytosine/adenosine deaminase-related metal-dependent hydrolase